MNGLANATNLKYDLLTVLIFLGILEISDENGFSKRNFHFIDFCPAKTIYI